MNTDNQADLSTAQNNATTNEGTSTPFDQSKLAEIISDSFLGGKESSAESPAEENGDSEAQATSEDDVHSQETETTNDQFQSEDSEETEETKSEDDEIERGLPKGVKKRIDKLSAKRREAEAEVERLKSEVERLSQEANKPAQTPTADNPYANLSTIDEVSREAEQAKQIRRWCEMNPDGAVVTGKDGSETEYTAEEVRNIKIKALDALEEHLPKRMQYLQNFNQMEQVATKEYPWWKDKSARERQIAESFIKNFPEIQRFPDYKMVLGDYIRGVNARETKGKTSGAPVKAPSQPRPSAAPARVPAKDAQSQAAQKRFTVSGSRDDLSSIIAKRFL
jgi:archaellum component FlaC